MKPMSTRFKIALPSGHRLYFFTLKGARAWLLNEAAEGRMHGGVVDIEPWGETETKKKPPEAAA